MNIQTLILSFCLASMSWIIGIILGILFWYLGIWIVILCILIIFFWRVPSFWATLICIACVTWWWMWSSSRLSLFDEQKNILWEHVGWDGFTHTITGTAVTLLSANDYNNQYKVVVSDIDWSAYPITLSLTLPTNITLSTGDIFTSVGKFRFPEDTGKYAGEKMLWYRGMVANFQSFQNKKTPSLNPSMVTKIQHWFDTRLRQIFPDPGYAVLSGILLGKRSAFDTELNNNLKASGLMHIMVVSGGNIMMLIIFLSLFLRSFPLWVRIGIIAFTIFGFCLIVWGEMSVWRAALMGVIWYTASLWGYRFPGLILPIIVAVLISFWNPLALIYDIGLQLSFFSVVCIIVWGKSLSRKLSFLGGFFAEAAALTLAATLGTLPLTIFYFGTFSLISPIANIFAAPAIPVLMYGGIGTLLASPISPSLAHWIGYIPWTATNYLIHIIHFFGNQKWSLITVDISTFSSLFMIISAGMLLLFIVRDQVRKV